MTRREFDAIDTFVELIDVARNDFECDDLVENFYCQDDFDEVVEDRAMDIISDRGWRSCEDYLYDLPSGSYDIYQQDEYDSDNWYGCDDGGSEFNDLKEEILSYAMDYDLFDEEEEEPCEDAEEEINDVVEFEEEDISFEAFNNDCAHELHIEVINRKPQEKVVAEDQFDTLFFNA